MIGIINIITKLPKELCEIIYLFMINDYKQKTKVKMLRFYEKEKYLVMMISKQLDADNIKMELYSSRNIHMKMFKYHYLDFVDTYFNENIILYELQIKNYTLIYDIEFSIKTNNLTLFKTLFNNSLYKYISMYHITLVLMYNHYDMLILMYNLFLELNTFNFYISKLDYTMHLSKFKKSKIINWINNELYLDYSDYYYKPKN
jgi:hypothetical protein